MYYRKLKLDFDPFDELPDHCFTNSNSNIDVWNKYIDSNVFNKSTKDWFTKNNLVLKSSMIFFYGPNCVSDIHVDGFVTPEYDYRQLSAINFTKGGQGLMQWFEPYGEPPTTPKLTRVAKSPFIKYDETNSRLADGYDVSTPALVRVDVPHRGINLSNEIRYSITLRWLPKLSWEEAQDKFKSFFL